MKEPGHDGTMVPSALSFAQPRELLLTARDNQVHWALLYVDQDGRHRLAALCGTAVDLGAGRDSLVHVLCAVTCDDCLRLAGPNRRLAFVRAALWVGHQLGEPHAN